MSFVMYSCFFFFKQKTAYEMRISDWSSDVCSSDLDDPFGDGDRTVEQFRIGHDVRDQTIFLCLSRVKAIAGQEQFGGARIAEHFLEQPGAAVAGNDAALDKAARAYRAFGGDAAIAGDGAVDAGPHRRAEARRDNQPLAVHPRRSTRTTDHYAK